MEIVQEAGGGGAASGGTPAFEDTDPSEDADPCEGTAGGGGDEQPDGEPKTWREAREAYERVFIRAALARHGGKIFLAAEELGLERTHLHKRIRELGLREEGL
jgi:DNA-binding NtrC family response regulator